MKSEIFAKYFTSEGCNVCKVLLPKIKQLFEEQYSNIQFDVVDVKVSPIEAANNQVFTIPVFVIYFEGKEQYRFVRVFSLEEIKEKLDRIISLTS